MPKKLTEKMVQSNKPFVWRIRKVIQDFCFYFKKKLFEFRWKSNERKRNRSLFVSIVTIVIKQILVYGIVAYILFKGEQYIFEILKVENAVVDSFQSIIIGGLGISGVVLGLYCANMSSIYASKYTNAPSSISQLFWNDPVIQKCLKDLIGYIIFCIVLLGSEIFGIGIGYISATAFLLFTAYTIVAFSITGNRSYLLSNSYFISEGSYNKILRSFKQLKRNNSLSSDASFQNHYRKICAGEIELLKEIITYNSDNSKNMNSAMVELMTRNIYLIDAYWEFKESIYYNSYWFQTKPRYKRWHETGDYEIQLALNTGTTINVDETEKNETWFEKEIIELNNKCLDKLCKDEDSQSIFRYIKTLTVLCEHYHSPEDSLFLLDLLRQYENKLDFLFVPTREKREQEADYDIYIAEQLGVLRGAIIVSINKYLASFSVESIESLAIERIKRNGLFYDIEFLNNATFDRLFQSIRTEIDIEKEQITPNWYIEQLIAKSIYEGMNNLCKVIVQLDQDILKESNKLLEKKCYMHSSVILVHLLEIASKSKISIAKIKKLYPELEKRHKDVKVIWPDSKVRELEQAEKDIAPKIYDGLSKCSISFSAENWENIKDFPDFLGFYFNHTCNYLVDCICNDDYESFEAIYKGFLAKTLFYQEYVRLDVIQIKESYRLPAVVHVATAPFIKYAQISGMAIIWGEISNNSKWGELIDSELRAFNKNNDQKDTFKQLVLFSQNRDVLGIGNRDVIETSWEMKVSSMIRNSRLLEYVDIGYGNKAIKTKSKLLKAFCGHSFELIGLGNKYQDIYFVKCINPLLSEEDKYHSWSRWEDNLKNDES